MRWLCDHGVVRDGDIEVALNQTGVTNLLKSVTRPLGGTFELAYERSGNTYEQPQSRWVLSAVQVKDGVPGDGVDTLMTNYRYADGYYDRWERDFYGYRTVTEEQGSIDAANPEQSPYRKSARTFRNDSSLPGKLAKEEVLTLPGASSPESENSASCGSPQVLRPARSRASSRSCPHRPKFFEGQGVGARRRTPPLSMTYGNVERFADAGDAGTGDDATAEIVYDYRPAADPEPAEDDHRHRRRR
jgi:hypothetical protein